MSRLWNVHDRSSIPLVKYGRMVHLRQGTIKPKEEEEEKKEEEEKEEGSSSLTTIVEKQDESGPDGRTTVEKGGKR